MVKPGSLDPDMHLDLEVKWLMYEADTFQILVLLKQKIIL